jgi:CDP-diacylglycerol--glycerol-3-phosphate 3-phosphatidyltransferase
MYFVSLDTFMGNLIAAGIFILASTSDYYDGYFARKLNMVSNYGKLMDPVADKIFITSVLVLMTPKGLIHPLMVIVILSRDIFIGGIRSAAAADHLIIDAKPTGKWKTALQMVALPAVLVGNFEYQNYPMPIGTFGNGILWISVVLSLISGWQYFRAYLECRSKASGK